MSFFNNQNDTMITVKRKGTVDDPFISISESGVVNSGRIVCSEVPDQFEGIQVFDTSTSTYLTQITSGTPTASQFLPNFIDGILTFNGANEGKTYQISYKGTGINYISSSRIFLEHDGSSVTKTLDDKLTEIDTATTNYDTAEATRVSQENSRITSESSRQSNEGTRVANENTRISGENTRITNMNNLLNNTQIQWKGAKDTYALLPASGQVTGDTWSVTADSDTTKNGFHRWSGTAWVKITSLNPSGTETIANVATVDKAKSSIVRDSIHSGVLTLAPFGYYTTTANQIKYNTEAVKYINGYKITIPANTVITLNPSPTFGTRNDLLMLEGYFPSTGNGYEMSYRLRAIDDVNFTLFPEGINDTSKVKAQGGAGSPTTYTYTKDTLDQGMYKAGDGSGAAKTALATLDGYVYSICLAQVKRRNSGGYRKDNLNGARDYYLLTGTGIAYSPNTTNITLTISNASNSGVKLGDAINLSWTSGGSTWRTAKVSDITTTNITVVLDAVTTDTVSGGILYFTLKSNRPDSLYSSIISDSDIIDLRHQVSLTGFDKNYLLSKSMEDLSQGKSSLRDSVKEVFNLQQAPLGLKQELVGVDVLGNDGVKRNLRNELGTDGNCEDTSKWSASGATGSLDSSNKVYGSNGIKITLSSTTGRISKSFSSLGLVSTKYYLFVADVKNGNATNIKVSAQTIGGNAITDISKFNTSYLKMSPSNISANTDLYIYVTGASGQYAYVDGIRIYEIDQATYDKIDVLSEFTGEELAKKFPYVDSYMNFVENLYQGFISQPFTTSATVKNNSEFEMEYTPDVLNRNGFVVFNVESNTTYAVSFEAVSSTANNGRLAIYTDDTVITITGYSSGNFTFNTGSNTKVRLYLKNELAIEKITFRNIKFEKSSVINSFVPYGRHYLPYDYASGQSKHYLTESLNGQRSIFSDAQTSETRHDKIEVLKTSQKHIKVTQATEGTWAINDTIKVKSDYGVVSGVIDADTAFARVLEDVSLSVSPVTLKLDDVSKFTVNDTFKRYNPSNEAFTGGDFTVTNIDATAKTITINFAGSYSFPKDIYLVETTASTSSPVAQYVEPIVINKTAQAGGDTTITLASDASATTDFYKDMEITITGGTGAGQVAKITAYNGTTKVATVANKWITNPTSSSIYKIVNPASKLNVSGTWTNLGTKEATFTLSAVPNVDDKTDILLQYSVNYPAGKGIVNLPTDVLEGEVNGQKLVKTTGNVVLKDNFAGKVNGSTDAVPHVHKGYYGSSLLAPSFASWVESSTNGYNALSTLDNSSTNLGQTSTSTYMAQQIMSFNLIEIAERKYGEGYFADCVTVADKVAKLKSGLAKVKSNWHGYGSSPTGNKANFKYWNVTSSVWGSNGSVNNHTNGTVTKIAWDSSTYGGANISDIIDSNGFVHFLAYAEPADTVTASTMYTDYVDIELEINPQETGYTVLAPEDKMPVLSENMLTSNQAFPVDLSGFFSNNATLSIDSIGVLKASVSTLSDTYVAFSKPTVKPNEYYTISYDVKTASGTGTMRVRSVQFNSSNAAIKDSSIADISVDTNWKTVTQVVKMEPTTATIEPRLQAVTVSDFLIRNIQVIAGSVNKPFSQGRNKKKILNYLGKVNGSTVENPHKYSWKNSNLFEAPSTFTNVPSSNTGYDQLSKQDGTLVVISYLTSGNYAQHLFEFDLSHLSLSLTELKKALRKLTVSWTGYGSGSNAGVLTYGATLKLWNRVDVAWQSPTTNTTNTPSAISISRTTFLDQFLTNDQKVYFLVHSTYASDSVIPSEIYTDYIKLEVELSDAVDIVKSNIILVQPETKQIKLKYPNKSHRYMGNGNGQDVVALHYRHIPVQSSQKGSATLLTQPRDFYITTFGTGSSSANTNSKYKNLAYKLLPTDTNRYSLLGENLWSFSDANIEQGLKKFLLNAIYSTDKSIVGSAITNTDTIFAAELPVVNTKNYLMYAPVLINVNGEIMLRIYYKWGKDMGNFVTATSSIDFIINGRPLIKNN